MTQTVQQARVTLQSWLDYLSGLHPSSIDLGLERVRAVAERLELIPVTVPAITVAGTNGKGSTVHLLESMLLAGGYKPGTFTSPHLERFNERIRCDGAEMSDTALCESFEAIENARQSTTLTYFEFSTLAALWLFRRSDVDAVLLEVGLGGRLDAVNIVDADVAVITSIGLDHAEWLGHDKGSIAREKAGIMRKHRQAIYGESAPQPALVEYAVQTGAPLWQAGRNLHVTRREDSWDLTMPGGSYINLPLPCPATQAHLDNAAAAVAALSALHPRLPVTVDTMRTGLARMRLPGRFQVVPGQVETVYDVAHNAEAALALAENLRRSPVTGRTLAVVGMLRDKPCAAFGKALAPVVSSWYAGGLNGDRGQSGFDLAAQLQGLGPSVQAYTDVVQAWHAAATEASPGDRILVCGSFYTVATIMEAARG